MPVKWKNSNRFKPALVLEKINAIRTINPKGGSSYSGFDLQVHLPVLQSMLEFPTAAQEVDASTLVWKVLGKIPETLTSKNVLEELNRELSNRLATKEERYLLVTSISLRATGLPSTLQHAGVKVRLPVGGRGIYIAAHRRDLGKHRVPIDPTPDDYQWVIAAVNAKSADAAFAKAMRVIDLQRALWCLMGNKGMSISLGAPSFEPINVCRLGGIHTIHRPGGREARDGIWFEPGFVATKLFQFDKPSTVAKNSRWALQRIQTCKYGDRIANALIRFVRALDQADPDSAFVRLWGALEALVTPDIADYDALVRRTAFVFQDGDYHRQILEHLREYRNNHLHGGLESSHARTHCFQLQMYFVQMAWFYIRNAKFFSSLNEVNKFLDQSPKLPILKRELALTKRAIRFVQPGEAK
jgi:hypothetical protein